MYNPNFTFRYLKTKVTIGDVLAAYGLDSQNGVTINYTVRVPSTMVTTPQLFVSI